MPTRVVDRPGAASGASVVFGSPTARRRRPRTYSAFDGRESAEDERKRRSRFFRELRDALCISAMLHLSLVLVLGTWKVLEMPRASGFVINSAVETGQNSLPTLDSTILHTGGSPDGNDVLAGDPRNGPDPRTAARIGLSGGGLGGGGTDGMWLPAGGKGARGGGVDFFGTRGQGRSFVFVVDCSGSMKGSRFQRAQEELQRAVREMNQQQLFFVFLYNNAAIPLFERDPRAGTLYATRDRRLRTGQWIQERKAGGGTEPAEALRLALGMNPDVIFFLTDGEIPPETPEVAEEWNVFGTVIHATAFESKKGEEMLKRIAAESGGTYRYIE